MGSLQLSAPGVNLLRQKIVPASDLGCTDLWGEGLSQDAQLLFGRLLPPALPAWDDLHPSHRSVVNFDHNCEISFETCTRSTPSKTLLHRTLTASIKMADSAGGQIGVHGWHWWGRIKALAARAR